MEVHIHAVVLNIVVAVAVVVVEVVVQVAHQIEVVQDLVPVQINNNIPMMLMTRFVSIESRLTA